MLANDAEFIAQPATITLTYVLSSRKLMQQMDDDGTASQMHMSPRSKGRPGRKRLGDEVFVPVTVKVEPSELATIESIAKYSGCSRSDVMRQMLSYGLAHVMQSAFGGGTASGPVISGDGPQGGAEDKPRTVVGTYLPSYALDVIGVLGKTTGQSRSKVLRTAVERALDAVPGGEDDD